MPQVYATEPVMFNGAVYLPGDVINGDQNDIAAIICSGRGTQDQAAATVSQAQYTAQQASAAVDASPVPASSK